MVAKWRPRQRMECQGSRVWRGGSRPHHRLRLPRGVKSVSNIFVVSRPSRMFLLNSRLDAARRSVLTPRMPTTTSRNARDLLRLRRRASALYFVEPVPIPPGNDAAPSPARTAFYQAAPRRRRSPNCGVLLLPKKLLYLVEARLERPPRPIPTTIELPNSQAIVSAPRHGNARLITSYRNFKEKFCC